jgi:hypothetical protein
MGTVYGIRDAPLIVVREWVRLNPAKVDEPTATARTMERERFEVVIR